MNVKILLDMFQKNNSSPNYCRLKFIIYNVVVEFLKRLGKNHNGGRLINVHEVTQ